MQDMQNFNHQPIRLPSFNFEGMGCNSDGNTNEDDPIPPHQLPYSFFPPPPIEDFSSQINWHDPEIHWHDLMVVAMLTSFMGNLPENVSSLLDGSAALTNLPNTVSPLEHATSAQVPVHNTPSTPCADSSETPFTPHADSPPTVPASVSLTDHIMEKGDSSSWASHNPICPVIPV